MNILRSRPEGALSSWAHGHTGTEAQGHADTKHRRIVVYLPPEVAGTNFANADLTGARLPRI